MRCSWCDPLLDQYVEGTLAAREMQRVSAHLEHCAACAALIAELRVVDALLATPLPSTLPPNFTFAVMAHVRDLPFPSAAGRSMWSVLALYLVATWLGLMATLWAFGPRAIVAGSWVRSSFSHALNAVTGAAHAIAPATPLVVGSVFAILVIDLALVAIVIWFYWFVRPRLAAHLSPLEAS